MGREIHVSAEDRLHVSDTTTSLTVPPETDANVEQLARDIGASKAEVFARALALLRLAVDAKGQGKRVGVVDREGHLETEITGL